MHFLSQSHLLDALIPHCLSQSLLPDEACECHPLPQQSVEMQSFAQFGSDLDADTKARLEQGARIVEVLKQNQNAPVPVEKQVAILYAVTKGILSKVATEDVRSYETGLYTWIDSDPQGAAAMQEIRSTGALSAETEAKLKAALEQYTENFVNTRPEK